jgi:hypothetical protein
MILSERSLPDGREAAVIPLTYGRARIIVSERPESVCYEDAW